MFVEASQKLVVALKCDDLSISSLWVWMSGRVAAHFDDVEFSFKRGVKPQQPVAEFLWLIKSEGLVEGKRERIAAHYELPGIGLVVLLIMLYTTNYVSELLDQLRFVRSYCEGPYS